MSPRPEQPVKEPGEWNAIDIECRGPRIKITLNGQLVQDVDQSTVEEIKNKPLVERPFVTALRLFAAHLATRRLRWVKAKVGDAGDAFRVGELRRTLGPLSVNHLGQIPAVTVLAPGSGTIEGVINATGTLAARREMPVGVVGEGGRVISVPVEAGDWVGAGQVLAVIDRSVQSQQAESQAAQIQVARADAELAQANLDRALQLVDRGFISKADVDRLTATRDAAAARVRVAEAQYGERLEGDEAHGRRVRMGHVAFVGSHRVNGVSAHHTDLMRRTVFKDLNRLYPDRIVNKTKREKGQTKRGKTKGGKKR